MSFWSQHKAFWQWMANPVHAGVFVNRMLDIFVVVAGTLFWGHLVEHDHGDHIEVFGAILSFLCALQGISWAAYKTQRSTSTDGGDPTEQPGKQPPLVKAKENAAGDVVPAPVGTTVEQQAGNATVPAPVVVPPAQVVTSSSVFAPPVVADFGGGRSARDHENGIDPAP